MAGRLGADPDDIAYVIGFETGPYPFSPAARNPQSGATGLIQFVEPTAKRLGFTLEELASMSFIEQLERAVEPYFEPSRGKLNSLADVYLAVFWPAAVGKSDDFVIAREGAPGYEGQAYDQNSKFDRQGKGWYTRGDVVAEVRAYAAVPRGRIPVSGGAFSLDNSAIIFLGAVAGLSAVWYSQKRGEARFAWLR